VVVVVVIVVVVVVVVVVGIGSTRKVKKGIEGGRANVQRIAIIL